MFHTVFYYLIKTASLDFFKSYESFTIKSDTQPLVWLTAVFSSQSFHLQNSRMEETILHSCFKVSINLLKKQSLILFCFTLPAPLGQEFAVQIRMEIHRKETFFFLFLNFYFSTNDSLHLQNIDQINAFNFIFLSFLVRIDLFISHFYFTWKIIFCQIHLLKH